MYLGWSVKGVREEVRWIKMKLLNREEAAGFLRISIRSLDRLASKGEIPYSKIGKKVVYSQTDLESYFRKMRIGNQAREAAKKIREAETA